MESEWVLHSPGCYRTQSDQGNLPRKHLTLNWVECILNLTRGGHLMWLGIPALQVSLSFSSNPSSALDSSFLLMHILLGNRWWLADWVPTTQIGDVAPLHAGSEPADGSFLSGSCLSACQVKDKLNAS